MSAEIEQSLRTALRPSEPPEGSLESALAHLDTHAAAGRAPGRRSRLLGGLALAGTLAGFAAFLVLALPRGTDTPTPTPSGQATGFSVLRGNAFPDPELLRPDTGGDLGFPGVQLGSLRLARDLPTGVRAVVGQTGAGFVCLFAMPPRLSFRSGTCAPADDVRRAALVQPSWWNRPQTLVLVPDGTRVRTVSGRPVAVRNNVAVLEDSVRQVVLVSASGERRVRLDAESPVPLTPQERRAPAVVPDLTGLTPSEAAEVLRSARLADGALEPRSVATGPNTIVGQSPPPGTTAAAGSEIGLAVSTPAGPGGTRSTVPSDATIRWAPAGSSNPFRTDRLAAFRGTVTILVFARLRADAEAIARLSTPPLATAPIAVALDGTEARALSFRRARSGFGVAADPTGALARAVGVTGAPSVVILDREGRVAYRRTGGLDLRGVPAVVAALVTEPAPADVPVPDAPSAVRLLQAVTPLSPQDVPQAVLRHGAADVVPQRVWAWGPSRSGLRVWIAMNRPLPGSGGVTFTAVIARGIPRGTTGATVSPFFQPGKDPRVLPLGASSSGGVTRLLWAVGPGYTEVVGVGDASITNGLLEVEVTGPMPTRITLAGPAGRAVIPVP